MSDDEKLMGAVAYLFGWLTGIVVYLVKKDSKFARFHAIQSILLSIVMACIVFVLMVVLWIAGIVLAFATKGLGMLVAPAGMLVLMLGVLGLVVFMMYKAYSGVKYKLPVIGNLAEKYA